MRFYVKCLYAHVGTVCMSQNLKNIYSLGQYAPFCDSVEYCTALTVEVQYKLIIVTMNINRNDQ